MGNVYGRLSMVRHRVGVVEFRVEQHQDATLADGRTVAAHLAPLAR